MKENNVIKEVTIGKQIWSQKNLEVTTFMNGDEIPEVKTNKAWKEAAKANNRKDKNGGGRGCHHYGRV